MKILVAHANLDVGKIEVVELPLRHNLVAAILMQLWNIRRKWPTDEIRLAGEGLVRITCGEEEENDGHGKAAGT